MGCVVGEWLRRGGSGRGGENGSRMVRGQRELVSWGGFCFLDQRGLLSNSSCAHCWNLAGRGNTSPCSLSPTGHPKRRPPPLLLPLAAQVSCPPEEADSFTLAPCHQRCREDRGLVAPYLSSWSDCLVSSGGQTGAIPSRLYSWHLQKPEPLRAAKHMPVQHY